MSNALFENLATLGEEKGRLDEKRLYELSELSFVIWQRVKEGKISLKTPYGFSDGVAPFLKRTDVLYKGYAEYEPFLDRARLCERALMCAALSRFLSERLGKEAFCPFPKTKGKGTRVAYVPSPLSEAAYTVISGRRDTSVLYISGAAEAFAALGASEADYALLPLSYQDGERIPSIGKLARQAEAYIAATVSVLDGEREATYALYSLEPSPFVESESCFLEWQLTQNSYDDVSLLMSGVSLFGHTLAEYRCSPSEYGRVNCRATLYGKGDDAALWFYLSIMAGEFSLLGVYPRLEAK